MNKIFTCFFASMFCIGAAIADDSAVISRAIPTAKPSPVAAVETSATTASRVAISRGVLPKTPVLAPESPEEYYTDEIVETVMTPVPATTTPARATRAVATTSGVDASRAGSGVTRTSVSRAVSASPAAARANLESTVNTVGRNARTEAAGMNASPALRRAGITVRPTTAEVGGRATIGNTGVQTGSNIGEQARSVQSRAATMSKEKIAEARETMEITADLNKTCQAQYNDCMDQFCAVIDANQKRCSCSANLSRYTRVESAVKEANTQLNDVAQRIRYVGLSADEIRAIMTATEAEEVLTGTKDNTESRNMLEAIEKMIKDPTGSTTASASSSLLDMDLDFSSDANDMFSLDFLGTSANTFSNLRGAELYNSAKKRCNTILTQCKNVGATQQQIIANYDIAIDKDCIAYETGLKKMNDTLKSNVRSADQMLKKARLAVLENKNQYDIKGCVQALDTCMVDDMVCGADYTKCLDPTKRYIDENGKVVLGENISNILAFMDGYNNALVDKVYLGNARSIGMNVNTCKTSQGACNVKYLLEKIGTGKTVKDGGLCRAVLDKCQMYTYTDTSSKYNEYNDVVINYVQRAMVNVAAAQRRIISDYSSNCMVDIASCYNQQVSQVNSWSSAASTASVYNVMRGACRNVALTCAYAVFSGGESACDVVQDNAWIGGVCTATPDNYINAVSEMFYQSLLCPENSMYQPTAKADVTDPDVQALYVNDRCMCDVGYLVWGKTCTRKCAGGTYRDNLGGCTNCAAGYFSQNGVEEGGRCTQQCTAGFYCPAGTATPIQCGAGFYCPAGTVTPLKCSDYDTTKPNSPAGSTSSASCTA